MMRGQENYMRKNLERVCISTALKMLVLLVHLKRLLKCREDRELREDEL